MTIDVPAARRRVPLPENDPNLSYRPGSPERAELKARLAAMAGKESVKRAFESGLSDGVMFERRLFHALFSSVDQKEGMDAFVNKRKPQFTNR